MSLQPNFQKGELDRISIFRGGCNFYIKNKLKFEIFNDKKSLFFSVITKNVNWEILTKNLATFKRWDELKDENLNITEVYLKI